VLAISASTTPAQATPAQAGPAVPEVLVLGDSLAVGMRPSLRELLPDRTLTFDVRSGRTTPQGLAALRRERRHVRPQTVVVSLGTNDGSSTTTFYDRIQRVLSAVPDDACVVWPAVTRPPRKGAYDGLNRALRRQARRDHRLTVVNWDRMVAHGTVRLPDGVHPDAEGFRFRSWVIAAAVRRGCSSTA